jgi:chemotaxis response regulator CheB
MPKAAVDVGAAVDVLSVSDIPRKLCSLYAMN